MPDNLSVRLQTNGKGGRPLGEQSAKAVLIGLVVMLELPELEGPQGQREPGRFGENALVVSKQAGAQ
jgi:hypothetical protein